MLIDFCTKNCFYELRDELLKAQREIKIKERSHETNSTLFS